MKIVLRNTTIRKDAVYVISREGDVVIGFWGEYGRYLQKGNAGLRHQIKSGVNDGSWAASKAVTKLLIQKLKKAYRPIAFEELTPNASNILRQFGFDVPKVVTAPVDPIDALKSASKSRRIVAEYRDKPVKDANMEREEPPRAPKTRAAWLEF